MQRAQKICVLISAVLASFALAGDAAAKEKRQGTTSSDTSGSHNKDKTKSKDTSGTSSTSGQAGQNQPGEVMAARMSATATVEKIDTKKRKLTVKDEQGRSLTLDVPDSVSNLSSIKKGDKVSVDYFSAIGLMLKPKGSAAKNESSMGGERTAAPLPGGMVARKVTATVEVKDVDTSNNTLTIKGPQGNEVMVNITDPQMQSELTKLKKGDKLQITYADAVAINVTPSSSTQQSSSQTPSSSSSSNPSSSSSSSNPSGGGY